ncbi:hypothetical protein ACFIQF_16710 [Comamonas sp. J-3]|uniref:hypothetical protein n=1 Tax=Comamonas trifloxystrobinivorans TaxID=3350256 RepID=UPI00372ABDD8
MEHSLRQQQGQRTNKAIQNPCRWPMAPTATANRSDYRLSARLAQAAAVSQQKAVRLGSGTAGWEKRC